MKLASSINIYQKDGIGATLLAWAEHLPRKPEYRIRFSIPTNWCTSCQLTLRTDDEYRAHVRQFPTHNVKPITKLICPRCGDQTDLELGRFKEHFVGDNRRKCPGSGTEA